MSELSPHREVVHRGTDWEYMSVILKANPSTGLERSVRDGVSRANSPTRFNTPMDYSANKMYSTITSEDSLLTQLWFEANEYPYCKSMHNIYCEPEYGLIMKLSCLPWGYDVDESPYIKYPEEETA